MKKKFRILLLGDSEEDKRLYTEKFLNTIQWEKGWALDWSSEGRCLCSMDYERSVGFRIVNYDEDIMKTPESLYFSPQYVTKDMSEADAVLLFLDAEKLIKKEWQDEMRFRRWMYILQRYFTGAGKITVMLTNYEQAKVFADFEEICRPLRPLLDLLEGRDTAVLEIKILNYEEKSCGRDHFTKPVLDVMLKKAEELVKEQEKIYQECVREEEFYRRRSSLLDTIYKKYLCGGVRTNEEIAKSKRENAIDEAVVLKSEQRAWQNLYWESKRLGGG